MEEKRLPRWADPARWPSWFYAFALYGCALATAGALIDAVTAWDWLLTPVFVALAAACGHATWNIRRLRMAGTQ
jgi:hypothetical protein